MRGSPGGREPQPAVLQGSPLPRGAWACKTAERRRPEPGRARLSQVEAHSLQFCRRTPCPSVPGHAKLQKGVDAHGSGRSKPQPAAPQANAWPSCAWTCKTAESCRTALPSLGRFQAGRPGSLARPCEARSAAKVQEVSGMTERWLPAGKITISEPSWTYHPKHHPRHRDDPRGERGSSRGERRQPRKAPVFSGPTS